MKKYIILALLLFVLGGCSPAEDEYLVEPTPVPVNQASRIEEANVASLPGSNPAENSEELGAKDDEAGADGMDEVEKVAPSGSVNLIDLTPVKETTLTEKDAIVQPAPGVPNSQAKVEQIAIQDLANHLGVRVENVEVKSGEEVEWSDGSLGCPEKDRMYIQVITPGYLFVLEVDGQEYEYHTDLQDQLILCIDGRPAGLPAPTP